MKSIYFILLFFGFSVIPSQTSAQNLIQNGDFENKRKSEFYASYFIFNSVKKWHNPTLASSDVQTNRKHWSDNNNITAYSGDTYAAIVVVADYDYSEYITNRLAHKLVKDSLYCLSMYVAISSRSVCSIRGLDALFTKKRTKLFTFKKLSKKFKPSMTAGNAYITNKTYWIKISGIYKAKGGEKFVTLGNFSNTDSLIFYKLNKIQIFKNQGYLLIDDVSLKQVKDSSKCTCNRHIDFASVKINADTIKKGDEDDSVIFSQGTKIELRNIYFETNDYVLKKESEAELNRLIELLKKHPDIKICINGFTDNRGKPKRNLYLSKQRAKAVVDYLISHGIDDKRLKYRGYGSDNPVADNRTPEGRAKNRRVEFEVIK